MRRFALLGLCCLSLSGCGFDEWYRPPFFAGPDPYRPAGDAENMRRARGQTVVVTPLSQEAGNVWPGPVQPTPSLEDLVKQERNGQLPAIEQLPGQPPAPAVPAPQSGPAFVPPVRPVVPSVPPAPAPARPGTAVPPPAASTGQVVQTPQGPGVTTGGTGAFKSITLPNGMTGIVVPNGNGTSTVIFSNGQVQTIPDTK
ncbi:MAG TPA: hypothetical protein VFA03_04805 [Acetobacteraceae bacterium]|nr:hypothetical protein [Acetobacteraceae bacterium]